MELIRGAVPEWARSGSGSGSGYGSGDGYGSGSGYGYGYGYGYGSGSGVISCAPMPVTITADMIAAHRPCDGSVAAFKRAFPDGAQFPADLDKARAAGLDVEWARQKFGLLMPVPS